MRSLPQPLTRGWHLSLLLSSTEPHQSLLFSVLSERVAPICGCGLPHVRLQTTLLPFLSVRGHPSWCTARHIHSALRTSPEHTGLIPARRPLPLSVRVRGSAPLCCLGATWPRGPWKASLFGTLAETLLQELGIAELPCPGCSLQSKDAPSLSVHL